MFMRANVSASPNLSRQARTGDGMLAHLAKVVQSADSSQTVSVDAVSAGLYQRTGMTAGRSDTTPTAAAIIASMPSMDIGDTYLMAVSVTTAFALTFLAGAGVTLGAKTSVPASSFGFVMITRTGAATVLWEVL